MLSGAYLQTASPRADGGFDPFPIKAGGRHRLSASGNFRNFDNEGSAPWAYQVDCQKLHE